MFGLIKFEKNDWSCAAFGKHPAGGDFLRAGKIKPLLLIFSKWMEKGFSTLPEQRQKKKDYSWRFWSKGPNGEFICGIIKSSSDSHGRIYPILLVGCAKKTDIFKKWDFIPYACMETWDAMEILSSEKLKNLRDLKEKLRKIPQPITEEKQLIRKHTDFINLKISSLEKGRKSDLMNKMHNPEALRRAREFSVVFDEKDNVDIACVRLFSLIKNRGDKGPDAVFTGGDIDIRKMLYLKRLPVVDDFKKLWF